MIDDSDFIFAQSLREKKCFRWCHTNTLGTILRRFPPQLLFQLSSSDGALDCDGDSDVDIVGEGVDDGVGDVVGEGVVGDACVTDRDTQPRLLPFQLARELARDTPRVHPV